MRDLRNVGNFYFGAVESLETYGEEISWVREYCQYCQI